MYETNKMRSMRFWSALAATASGLTWSAGFSPIEPMGGTVAYGQLMAPPAITPPPATSPVATPNSINPNPATNAPALAAPVNPLRDQAVNLTAQAKFALGRGDVSNAKSLIEKANALRVPDSEFSSGQLRPWQVAMEIDRAERQRTGMTTAPALRPITPAPNTPNLAQSNPPSFAALRLRTQSEMRIQFRI